jgi:hypothetical protein
MPLHVSEERIKFVAQFVCGLLSILKIEIALRRRSVIQENICDIFVAIRMHNKVPDLQKITSFHRALFAKAVEFLNNKSFLLKMPGESEL